MRALRIDPTANAKVIEADLESIRQGVGTEDLGHASLQGSTLDSFSVPVDVGITMWHDDLAYLREPQPAPNALATGLHATGHVILGNVVLQAYSRNSGETVDLPETVIQELQRPEGDTRDAT